MPDEQTGRKQNMPAEPDRFLLETASQARNDRRPLGAGTRPEMTRWE